jgi:hypothetical protein
MRDADPGVDPVAAALLRLCAELGATRPANDRPRGVVGSSSPSGASRYGYPEIAGYWLHWSSPRADVDAAAGDAVVEWLENHQSHDGWPTRVSAAPLDGAYARTRYLFDHLVLWNGLSQWGNVRRSAKATALADRAWLQARQFTENGGLIATRGAPSGRWSGRVGQFLLKVCARARHGDDELGAACRRALPELVDAALAQPHAEAHPQLYAIEGLIVLGERDAATTALQALIAAHGGVRAVREAVGGGPRRSDVLAQLLRAALWLDVAQRNDPEWSALAMELTRRVDAHGRVPFAAPGDDCPTWAALFAEQALALWLGQSIAPGEVV